MMDQLHSTTQAIVLHGPRDLRTETHPLPPPAADELQIQILRTGLCGSDQHYYTHFRNGPFAARSPLIPGHEAAGIVTHVGRDAASSFRPGDRVALEVGVPCGECPFCVPAPDKGPTCSNSTPPAKAPPESQPRYNLCPSMRFRSSASSFPHYPGTLQLRLNHPAAWCHVLPASIPWDIGALIEPLAVAVHAARRAQLQAGETVLVLGVGAVGLLCAWVARGRGAKGVVAGDRDAGRVGFAVEKGWTDRGVVVGGSEEGEAGLEEARSRAEVLRGGVSAAEGLPTPSPSVSDDEGVEDLRGGGSAVGDERRYGFDVVFECTGSEACVQTAIYAAKQGGRVILVGMGTPVQTLPLGAAALREVDLRGVFRYAGTYPEAIRMVENHDPGLPDLGGLVTHRVRGLEEVARGFELAGKGGNVGDDGLVLKVMVDVAE